MIFMFCSSRRRRTRCALVTGVQTCALPIFRLWGGDPVMTAKRYLKAAAERHTVYRGNDRLGARLHGVNHFRQHGVGCKLAELGDVRAARKKPDRAPDTARLHRGNGLRIGNSARKSVV